MQGGNYRWRRAHTQKHAGRIRAEAVLVRARDAVAAAEATHARAKAAYDAHVANPPPVPEAAVMRASAMQREATRRHRHADEAARLREALRVAQDALSAQQLVLKDAQQRLAAAIDTEHGFDRHRARVAATERRAHEAAEDEEQAELSGKFARRRPGP